MTAAKKTFWLILAFLGLALGAEAQTKHISRDKNLWLRYFARVSLPHDWGIDLEVEDRRYAFPDRQLNWLLPRVSLHHPIAGGWSANVGFLYYTTATPPEPKSEVELTVPELRPHVELDYRHKIQALDISHRYRLEERFTRRTENGALAQGYDFQFRFRYRLQAQYPLLRPSSGRDLKAVVSDEILLNLGHRVVRNTFDGNRLYAGLNYRFSPVFQLEAGYMKFVQEKKNGDDYLSRDLLRVTLYHQIRFGH